MRAWFALLLSAPVVLVGGSSFAAGAALKYVATVYRDAQGVGLKDPQGVSCDGEGRFWIADTGNGRIVRFVMRERIPSEVAAIRVDELKAPIRVHAEPGGTILALDGGGARLVRLSQAGAFLEYVEPKGVPGGGTLSLRSFALDSSGHLFLLDVFAGRVLELDRGGLFQRELRLPQGYGFVSDLTVDRNRTVYAIDCIRSVIYVGAPGESVLKPLGPSFKELARFPAGLTTDGSGNLLVSDRNGGRLVVVGLDGTPHTQQSRLGWKEGRLYYPEQVCVGKDAYALVADRGNSRVQVFSVSR